MPTTVPIEVTEPERSGLPSSEPELLRRVQIKVFWRIVPVLFAAYVISFLDRVNVGFAALQMNKQLGFTPVIFSTGVSLFFLGYLVCEIPSNTMILRFGARRWLARIMVTWGIIECLNALISGPNSFYVMRLLLGVAEAGLFPGVIFYVTYWIAAGNRARATATLMLGLPVSLVIGSPISGALLTMDGFAGLAGWQWLFIIEGLPAILLGVAVLRLLPDGPAAASWLTRAESHMIEQSVGAPQQRAEGRHSHMNAVVSAVLHPNILLLGAVNFTWGAVIYGLTFWLPQILKSLGGLSNLEIGLLGALPYTVAAVVMVLWARHSDLTGERVWHASIALFVASLGFILTSLMTDPYLALVGTTITATGVMSFAGVFFVLPGSYMTGAAAAGGIAMVTTFGNLGGFVGPFIVGLLLNQFHDFRLALLALALFAAAGGAGTLFLLRTPAKIMPQRV